MISRNRFCIATEIVNVDMGMRLILAGSEFVFMMQGARAQSQAVRALK